MASLPAKLGFRMPGEWEPHEATWIAWPHNRADWPDKFPTIPWVFVEIVRHLHQVEGVRILINDRPSQLQVQRLLSRANINVSRIDFLEIPTNRVWTRDYGPMFVVSASGEKAIIKWKFNGWAKYADWHQDDEVVLKIGPSMGMRVRTANQKQNPVVLEGGSIDVNGQGLLLTTEECLLSAEQERNPGLKRADYERLLSNYLGIKKVLWLGRGIVGDDTHGHVDDLARFVGPRTVVAAVEEDPRDPNHEPLQDNLCRLRHFQDLDGRALEIVHLPMPAPVYFSCQRLPASYANFYVANNLVLVPTFNDPHDRRALAILAELFPDRTVVGIHAVDLVWGLGTLHCLTQQQPRP